MATTARRCAGCGAPLPQTTEGTRQQSCPFCGIVNDLAHAAPRQTPVELKIDVGDFVQGATHAGRKLAKGILVGIAVVAVAGLAVVYMATRPVRDALQRAGEQARRVQTGQQPIAPSALATTDGGGWREVKVTDPEGGWDTFDPIANLDWARSIARAWQTDARLTRVDVTRVSSAGIVDLTATPEDTVGYRFVSPSKVEEWGKIADRESNVRVPYELMLRIAQRKTVAHITTGRPPAGALPPANVDSRRLGDLVATAKRGRGFAEYPFYNGYLIHNDREGWVWYLQSLSRREGLPRVRARDGAVYPYPR